MSLYEKEGRCSDEKSAAERKRKTPQKRGLMGRFTVKFSLAVLGGGLPVMIA
jgi:hypothetical protein